MRVPSYRLHRATGQAVVTLNGRDHYLGKHGTETSRSEYDRLIARWVAGGRRLETFRSEGPTVDELLARYWTWADRHYRKHGEPTSQIAMIRRVGADLHAMFGPDPVGEFTPTKLKSLREHWVNQGSARTYANRRIGIVLGILAWGVEEEMVPGSVLHSLRAVRPLEMGRTTAHETEPIGPAPIEHVEAVTRAIGKTAAAMIRLQLATGMRPGEVVAMRFEEIDRTGETWVYRPATHKTEHRGKDRPIMLGPAARAIVEPLLTRPGLVFRNRYGKSYRVKTYYAVVADTCQRIGVPHWHPSQLRHNFATLVRSRFGIEASRVLLGHSSLSTTEIYAEKDLTAAAKHIEAIG